MEMSIQHSKRMRLEPEKTVEIFTKVKRMRKPEFPEFSKRQRKEEKKIEELYFPKPLYDKFTWFKLYGG
jgi:hypothetical protein